MRKTAFALRRLMAFGAIFVFIVCFAALPCAAAQSGPTGILLSWTGDTKTGITVTWHDGRQAEEVLQLTSLADYTENGFEKAEQIQANCTDISLDGSGEWHYEASASGLSAGTSYAYRVGCADEWSETHRFTTQENEENSLSFFYMGDIQVVKDSAEEYAEWGKLAQDAYERNPEAAFAVLGGDIVESGISAEQYRLFRESAQSVFSNIPLMATNGNHESNFISGKPELYLDEFAFPQNGPEGFKEEFYSFDAGNCHVLVLNSWIFSGEQKLSDADIQRVNNWIADDLAQSTADWQIVVTHVPVYAVCSDSTATAVRENWEPIFEKYGVDLVFEGHQHVYSRSYPIYSGKVDYENGITYIMGVSGKKFYDSADESFAERTVYNTSNYELVQSDGKSLTVQALDEDGNELDFTTLMQRKITATREEYVETLWRGAGSPEPDAASPFTDTSSKAVAWAYGTGLVQGYGGGIFGAGDTVTAGQAELILNRMHGSEK